MPRTVTASMQRLIGRLKCPPTSRIRRQDNVVKAERHCPHLVQHKYHIMNIKT